MTSNALPPTVTWALSHSRFLGRMLQSRSWLLQTLVENQDEPITEKAMQAFLDRPTLTEDRLKERLRSLRTWVLCHLICRDLSGQADLDEVTQTMTRLADVTVNTAYEVLRAALVDRHGEPLGASGWAQDLLIVGMGKLGGHELNVSSDIDLIFIYPEEGETAGRKPISNFEFFERLGKKIIQALGEITEHGQVFRVDMRLRPNGDSGALVCSLDALENYFITQGREWERYAWIKSRVMTGESWQALEAVVRPFVFRKYLDFGAINAMRELHAQIRREVARKDNFHNVKLGPGGIREIEFIAQVFQLIRGGREKDLQIRSTCRVLRLLAEKGMLEAETVAALIEAYVFLRRLEHRLQYLDDAQTHLLPDHPEDQARIASAMGFDTYADMMAVLDGHRAKVSQHFEAVFAAPEEEAHALDGVWSAFEEGHCTLDRLAQAGFADPKAAQSRLAGIHAGHRYRALPENIKTRFDVLVPRVLEAAASAAEPDATLSRCLDLLEAISRRGAYLALLQQYPQALRRLADLVGASRWAAQYLIRHPLLLDELLDARNLETEPDWPAFRAKLSDEIRALEPDTERQMDVMREHHHAQVFRLLTRDLAGTLTVERLADHLSALADIVLAETIGPCWQRLRNRHRDIPRFAIIAYGKLGGKELGYASDLDIVFLYDDEAPEATELYSRLAQRINTWLSSQTASGILFETDLRLRPNGDAGLLVTSLAAFEKYQQESAWVWEHQALTRARFAAGDPDVGARFEAIRTQVLCKARNAETLKIDVLQMREKMRKAHGSKGAFFELKHDPGGLVDVEFIIQYLVLRHAHEHPELTQNLGNIALLHRCAEYGLIPDSMALACAEAYRMFRRLQHAQRLNDHASQVPPDKGVSERESVRALWDLIFSD
jgi:[glutamine synthetase] adenylyltransferase / [glutamine synthetase]-adenylyl-L-tyrosine phosphorylase